MMEIWKDVIGYEGLYQVSNKGDVKSKSGRILKHNLNTQGYPHVGLSKSNKQKTIPVHILVAEHFLTKPDFKCEVNHKDGNKLNPRSDNLEWVTRSENEKHAYDLRLKSRAGELNTQSKLTRDEVLEIRRLKSVGYRNARIAEMFNVTPSNVSIICSGKSWGCLA